MGRRIFIDTDIGTDIDDVFALLLALASREPDIVGITTCYGDTTLRAGIVRRVLELAGAADIPVGRGPETLLTSGKRPETAHWVGRGFVEAEQYSAAQFPDAVDMLIEAAESYPGELTVVAIGPLTNIALAMQRDPSFSSKVGELIVMGGVIECPACNWSLTEYNFSCDPEATWCVFASGIPLTMVGLDVTCRVRLEREDMARLRCIETELMQGVCRMLDIWLEQLRLRGESDSYTYMHDPLALSVAIDRSLVKTRRVHVDIRVSPQGAVSVIADNRIPNAAVCLEVDASRFNSFLMDRLLSAYSGPMR